MPVPEVNVTHHTVAENLARVRARIAEAARRSGQRVFGENYVQEALPKIAALPGDARWHLIGHLQSNKAKAAAERFACVETVDSPRLARALERHAAGSGTAPEALVQVNWSEEASKSGVTDPEALRRLVAELAGCGHLRLRGLMTIPDPACGEAELRRCFAGMRRLREALAAEFGLGGRLTELSMGMSHDYEWAVEEGATIVRVGTAIFGARP